MLDIHFELPWTNYQPATTEVRFDFNVSDTKHNNLNIFYELSVQIRDAKLYLETSKLENPYVIDNFVTSIHSLRLKI